MSATGRKFFSGGFAVKLFRRAPELYSPFCPIQCAHDLYKCFALRSIPSHLMLARTKKYGFNYGKLKCTARILEANIILSAFFSRPGLCRRRPFSLSPERFACAWISSHVTLIVSCFPRSARLRGKCKKKEAKNENKKSPHEEHEERNERGNQITSWNDEVRNEKYPFRHNPILSADSFFFLFAFLHRLLKCVPY